MRWRLGMIVALGLGCLAVPEAEAGPLVTIHCDQLKGFNIAYGTTLTERFEARKKTAGTTARTKGAH